MSERRAGFCLYKLRVHTGASFSGLRAGQLSRRVRSSTRLDWQSQNLLFWCVVRVCGGNGPGCVCELLLPLFTSPLHLRFRLSASASSRSYLSASSLAHPAGPERASQPPNSAVLRFQQRQTDTGTTLSVKSGRSNRRATTSTNF